MLRLPIQRVLLPVCFFVVFLVTGCSFLPRQVAVTGNEKRSAVEALQALTVERPACRSVEADVTVTLHSLFRSGTFSGFLQAMHPSFLKFIGLNPIGQPAMILVTDGARFRFVTVQEAKGYEGSVRARAFEKYAPSGFAPEQGFAWLTGRLPACRNLDIGTVTRDAENAGYRVEFACGPDAVRHRVLLDIEEKKMLRHSILDAEGRTTMEVMYGAYHGGECRWPGELRVTSNNSNGSMDFELRNITDEMVFSKSDFDYEPPAGFERVDVR